MWGENSSCQDSASLYIWHRVGMKNERATGTGSTTKSSETEKMEMCRKGRRHGMRVWKNVLFGTSWWTCWVYPTLCTSARVSRLPQRDAHRVHRHQQFSPAVPQIGWSPDDFGGAPIQWWADHGSDRSVQPFILYTLQELFVKLQGVKTVSPFSCLHITPPKSNRQCWRFTDLYFLLKSDILVWRS